MVERFDCPVCKHTEVIFECGKPVFATDKRYFSSICDNCKCMYCYKIETVENKKDEIK